MSLRHDASQRPVPVDILDALDAAQDERKALTGAFLRHLHLQLQPDGPPTTEVEISSFWKHYAAAVCLATRAAAAPASSPCAPARGPIVAWVRRRPDGSLTDEYLPDASIESVRKQSGAWLPMVLGDGVAGPSGGCALPEGSPS